jgi:hypothetical protein
MRMLRASARIRLIAAFLAVFLAGGVVTAEAAHAADEASEAQSLNADQLKRLAGLAEDQRNAMRDGLNKELGKSSCSNIAFYGSMGGANCENVATAAYNRFLTTPEQALDYTPARKEEFCSALGAENAPGPGIATCAAEAMWKKFAPLAGVALRTAISTQPGGQFVLGTVDTVAFVANAKDGFEKFANTVKNEGVKATNEVMNTLLKVSSFEVDDSFRNTWATFAGIGIVIMALMYFKLWKDVSNEEIDMDTARESFLWYGPLSMLLVLFGPAIGYQVNAWMTGITDSFTPWTSIRIADFAAAISRFASYESNGAFGPLAAVVLFGLLFLGAWALLGLFALQPFALYMLGVGLALMIGFMIHPKYRERVGKTGTLWIGIALSKPLLLLLVGAVFSFIVSRPAFTGEGVDDAMVNASSVFLAAAAMIVLAFSPALLFKYVPLLPSSSTGLGAGRQSVAGAAAVAGAGAGITSAIRNRRISQNRSGSTGTGTGGQGKGTTAESLRRDGQGASAEGGQETRTIGQLQRSSRSGGAGAKTGQALKSGAGAVGRGSAKVAAGGATAFLMAGREAARQAAMRGRQNAASSTPDTDHISGR